MDTIRVLIADDHPLMLRSLRMVLEGSDQVEVVAEATSGAQVLPLVESARPQVVLLDVQLPELDGFSCLERIVAAFPEVSVIMVSATDHPRTIDEAAKRGASGYIVKTVVPADFVDTIVAAARGDAFVAVGLTNPGDSDLTDRELAVVEAVARGLSNKEIGRELWITEQTVKFHLGNIFRKLDVANRTEAARVAFDRGLGRTGGPALDSALTPPAGSRR
jgi:two-component system, NarL family, response regulator DevR